MRVLVADVGTQRLKVAVVDERGRIVSSLDHEYDPPYVSPEPGWAEIDVEEVFQKFLDMASSLDLSGVSAVAVTSQRDSLVFVGEGGLPLRRAILWLDHRLADYDLHLPLWMNLVYTLAGAKRVIRAVYRQAKVNWIRQKEPEVWRKTSKVLQISGYFISRLTGRIVDSIASQVGHIPFDYRKQKWSSKWDIKSFLFPIPHEKLPELGRPGEIAGKLRREIAERIGLRGAEVVLAGSDKACEMLGLGVKDESTLFLSFSTTSVASTTTRRYFEPLPHLPPYPGMIPGTYNPEIEIFRGFWLVRWFRDEFAHLERKVAEERGEKVEELLDELLKLSPPGSLGLITRPYWTPGLDRPEAKGAIVGFSSFHKREHVYRSLIEGLFFALREGKERLEKRGRLKFDRVVAGGGGSKSDEIMRIAASVMKLPAYRGREEASVIGAAMAAFVGEGVYKTFEEAIEEMVSLDGPFEPRREDSEVYDFLYRSVYRKIHRGLRSIERALRDFGI